MSMEVVVSMEYLDGPVYSVFSRRSEVNFEDHAELLLVRCNNKVFLDELAMIKV
jgi:hypothetical protein